MSSCNFMLSWVEHEIHFIFLRSECLRLIESWYMYNRKKKQNQSSDGIQIVSVNRITNTTDGRKGSQILLTSGAPNIITHQHVCWWPYGPEVIKLEFILKLKIKSNDWLIVDRVNEIKSAKRTPYTFIHMNPLSKNPGSASEVDKISVTNPARSQQYYYPFLPLTTWIWSTFPTILRTRHLLKPLNINSLAILSNHHFTAILVYD